MRRFFLLLLAAMVVPSFPAAAAKPNVVVILVDDMGFSDLGCYGSEIPTPHLDALAQRGTRFTQFYNTARCCPSRASLLTGLYPHQTGVGHMVERQDTPGYLGHLNDQCVTLAEVLRSAGYFTAMSGKWHVGHEHGVTPQSRGFERSLHAAAGGFYYPGSRRAALSLNGEAISNDDSRLPKDWYSTDLWTQFGLQFIDEALAAQKPFYLHLCHNAPHFPLQAPEAEIAKFRGRYKAGWDALREARIERQRALGIIDPSWSPAPRPDSIAAWDSLSEAEKDRFDHLMAVYAAVVHHMDQAVGQLVEGLRKRGVLENTLILFMSDNGGNAEAGPLGKTEGEPTTASSSWFCGESWAWLQNTPLRRYKHFNHEGGIATPLIAHWPAALPEGRAGRIVHTPSHLIDIMATCVDVGGASYPKERAGKPVPPMEGLSLKPLLLSDTASLPERSLFWEHEKNAAVRRGSLKLVRVGAKGPWELYDLGVDRTERTDLAAQKPDVVQSLAKEWQSWAERTQVLPYPTAPASKKALKKAATE
jgi:arylsulfatase